MNTTFRAATLAVGLVLATPANALDHINFKQVRAAYACGYRSPTVERYGGAHHIPKYFSPAECAEAIAAVKKHEADEAQTWEDLRQIQRTLPPGYVPPVVCTTQYFSGIHLTQTVCE